MSQDKNPVCICGHPYSHHMLVGAKEMVSGICFHLAHCPNGQYCDCFSYTPVKQKRFHRVKKFLDGVVVLATKFYS
jgi:hypothetical protein